MEFIQWPHKYSLGTMNPATNQIEPTALYGLPFKIAFYHHKTKIIKNLVSLI